MDVSLGQLAHRLGQGDAGGVAAGDRRQETLHIKGAAQPLQIPHHGQGAVTLALPAECSAIQTHLYSHRHLLVVEALQHTIDLRARTEFLKGGDQVIEIAHDRWQDGKVGHEPDACCGRP